MSIEGKGHFFTIYFPGFVCFVLYLDKISGERLKDHWSSGLILVKHLKKKKDNKQCLLDTPNRVTVNNKRLVSKRKK